MGKPSIRSKPLGTAGDFPQDSPKCFAERIEPGALPVSLRYRFSSEAVVAMSAVCAFAKAAPAGMTRRLTDLSPRALE
jgi:hypothetical protein